jgi:hypothetical protein
VTGGASELAAIGTMVLVSRPGSKRVRTSKGWSASIRRAASVSQSRLAASTRSISSRTRPPQHWASSGPSG